MNITIRKTIVATAILLPLTSFAGDAGSESPYGRIYGQIDWGKTYTNINTKSFTGSNIDKQPSSAAIRLGYEFPSLSDLHLGIEAGSQYFGEYTIYNNAASLNFKQGAVDLLLVARKDINPVFSVFAKGGVASTIQQTSLSKYYSHFTTDQEMLAIHPEAAAGVKYDINRTVALVGTVNHIFADNLNANSPKLKYVSTTTASLGLRLTFG